MQTDSGAVWWIRETAGVTSHVETFSIFVSKLNYQSVTMLSFLDIVNGYAVVCHRVRRQLASQDRN